MSRYYLKRYEEAQQRNAERRTRTPEQQLKALDFRLGKGEGAARERKRLEEKCQKAN